MADTVKCSVCGEVNPADNEFCQNCQSRLQPLTGPLRAENAPISPGQAPTKKVTSELEPILPQWLRNARQQARQAADETPAEQEQKTRPAPRPDLLAGLQSQSGDEDEEMPDWLSHITGAPAKKKKVEPENTPVKFVELGDDEMAGPPAKQTSSDDENYIPSWMGQQEAAPEKDEMADWFKQAS
ncbi:MAG TPA: zinc ribbon domain-containing protein, partial [Anaerolineales bacterium]|nr:zinc ribbon domain-containing protein [Anaerolineales bacterium]